MQFLVSLKFGISLVVPLAVSLWDISILFLISTKAQTGYEEITFRRRRPSIVIKF